MNKEERVDRLERLEKLRYNLEGLLKYGWDESLVAIYLGLTNISPFKEIKEKIEVEITKIQYGL